MKPTVIIDVQDQDRVNNSGYKWCLNKLGYVRGYKPKSKPFESVLLHRFIMEAPAKVQVDHINGNRADNRRSNLRFATASQNQWNRGLQKNNKSGFKGVAIHLATGKWQAVIRYKGKAKALGLFDNPEDAHEAYCVEANRLHGEFAKT